MGKTHRIKGRIRQFYSNYWNLVWCVVFRGPNPGPEYSRKVSYHCFYISSSDTSDYEQNRLTIEKEIVVKCLPSMSEESLTPGSAK